MLSDKQYEFKKEELDFYLKELAKEYKKHGGAKMPAELILIGGASVLVNYGFRSMTTDIDALIHAASCMKDSIDRVADKYDLPYGWINEDFKRTDSYSDRIVQFSVHYRTFSNVLDVRTVTAEYLIAMKLRSGRQYKNDLSDVLGILAEQEKIGKPISFDQIKKAVRDLYGEWNILPDISRDYIEKVFKDGNFEKLYYDAVVMEKESKDILIEYLNDEHGSINKTNANEILQMLKKRSNDGSL